MLSSRRLSRKTKLRIYNSIIRPVLTYGCKSWTMRKKDRNRLDVFEHKVLRKITGPVCDPEWRRRTNQELRTVTEQPSIVTFIKKRRLQWAGHVARMDEEAYPKRALTHQERGKRPHGRPRNRWGDDVQRDLHQRQPWVQLAQDRLEWRRLAAEAGSRRTTYAPRS